MHTITNWSALPSDTQYYDTLHRIALKLSNKVVLEWSPNQHCWVRSYDYTSWIPLNRNMKKNPNYVAS